MEILRYRLGPGQPWREMTGLIGPKGDKGDKGDTGAQGEKGEKGDAGMSETEITAYIRQQLGVIENASY